MKITLLRHSKTNNETIGSIYIDGQFESFSLEDEKRETKVKGETRIPSGVYKLGLRNKNSGMHLEYKEKFKGVHIGMIEILSIVNFSDVYFHIGNTDKNTAGCVLVGDSAYYDKGKLKLSNSTLAYQRFYQKVIGEVAKGNCELYVIDADDLVIIG